MSEYVENEGVQGIDMTPVEAPEEPTGASLEEVVHDEGDTAKDDSSDAKAQKQGGWIQKRIEEGVNKRLDKTLADFQQKLESQYEEKYRPMQERLLSMEADELVKSGMMKTKDLALEYLRLKNGFPAPEKPEQPQRNEKGQFTQKADPTEERAKTLLAQAKSIKRHTGVDVLEIFNSDPEVKRRVSIGEMDFDDVAEQIQSRNAGKGRNIPTPVRTPNAGAAARTEIKDLSNKQFEELWDFLGKGGVLDTRK